MKTKLAIGVALSLFVNANVFAVEIYKGHVISHKEWATSNIKFSFNDTKMHFPKLQHPLNSKIGPALSPISVETMSQSIAGNLGQPVTIEGAVYTMITNGSDSSQTYQYSVEDCVAMDSTHTRCARYEDTLQLDPGGSAFYSIAPVMQLTFTSAGSYQNNIIAQVMGDNYNTNSASSADGTILIS